MDFLETDNDRNIRWVRGADKAANHKKKKKQRDGEAKTDDSAHGLVPAREK